jgi:predicted TIM-barrel fold metal-dependent hydrolase
VRESRVTSPLVVDSHLHLYRSSDEAEQERSSYETWEYGPSDRVSFSQRSGDPEGALAALADAGASAAIVVNLLTVTKANVDRRSDLVSFNTWLCELARDEPRFVPFIGIVPDLFPGDEAVAHVAEMVELHGAAGIKIHPVAHGWPVWDPLTWPVFALCESRGLGVIAHSGPSRIDPQCGQPNAYRSLLSAFPSLRIVLAHMGGGAWVQLPSIARDFPNAAFDLCEIVAWLGAPKAPSARELVSLIRQVGIHRVLMGSDFPWYDIDDTVATVLDLPGLTSSERSAILGENAARFFDLDL